MSSWSLRAARLALALAACLVAAPSGASAAFVASPAGGRANAGEVVPLSWSLDPSRVAGRDEMEIVLSLDDGATFPIRVLDRLDPSDRAVSWRVPALPTGRARLALRAGETEAPDAEEIVAVSEPFTISCVRLGRLEELFAVADEWRTREALEGAPVRSSAHGLASRESAPEVASSEAASGEPETSPAAPLAPASADSGLPNPAAAAVPVPARPPVSLRAPVPLRL